MLLLWLAFLPLRITADIYRSHRKLTRIYLECVLFRREWRMESLRVNGERQVHLLGPDGQPRRMAGKELASGPAAHLLGTLRHSKGIRRYLLRHTHAERLDVQLHLHTQSAASTALLSGGAQVVAATRAVTALLPPAWHGALRLRILPDFLAERCTLKARCIFRLRLGTILITACMLFASHLTNMRAQRAREASTWTTPSEN